MKVTKHYFLLIYILSCIWGCFGLIKFSKALEVDMYKFSKGIWVKDFDVSYTSVDTIVVFHLQDSNFSLNNYNFFEIISNVEGYNSSYLFYDEYFDSNAIKYLFGKSYILVDENNRIYDFEINDEHLQSNLLFNYNIDTREICRKYGYNNSIHENANFVIYLDDSYDFCLTATSSNYKVTSLSIRFI